jgi:hypothetical protein
VGKVREVGRSLERVIGRIAMAVRVGVVNIHDAVVPGIHPRAVGS